jgi:solute carrier family 20 (sodium-dependent phosphate transporter)
MEFAGAVLVGARVTSTIKDGIVPATTFEASPGVQLLGFTCAIVASSSTTFYFHGHTTTFG